MSSKSKTKKTARSLPAVEVATPDAGDSVSDRMPEPTTAPIAAESAGMTEHAQVDLVADSELVVLEDAKADPQPAAASIPEVQSVSACVATIDQPPTSPAPETSKCAADPESPPVLDFLPPSPWDRPFLLALQQEGLIGPDFEPGHARAFFMTLDPSVRKRVLLVANRVVAGAPNEYPPAIVRKALAGI